MHTTHPLAGPGTAIRSAQELGTLIRSTRERQGLSQKDVAGIGKTGNRVIVDIENGKPTVQFQKILNLLDLLGLQLTVKAKGAQ